MRGDRKTCAEKTPSPRHDFHSLRRAIRLAPSDRRGRASPGAA